MAQRARLRRGSDCVVQQKVSSLSNTLCSDLVVTRASVHGGAVLSEPRRMLTSELPCELPSPQPSSWDDDALSSPQTGALRLSRIISSLR